MNKSEHYGFDLPSSENPEEIANINVISQNFVLADRVIKNLSDTIETKTFGVDSNLSPTSKNPVENKVVSENVSPIRIKKTGNPIVIEDSSFIEHEIKANTRIPFENADNFNATSSFMPTEKAVLVVSSVEDVEEESGELYISIYFEGGWQLRDGSFYEPKPPVPKVGDKIFYNPDDGSLDLISDLTKYGKNLFDNDTSKIETITVKFSDGSTPLTRLGHKLFLPVGTYTIHPERIGEVKTEYVTAGIFDREGVRKGNAVGVVSGASLVTTTFTIGEGEFFMIYNGQDLSLANVIKLFSNYNIQLEVGKTKTDYVPFVEPQTGITYENGDVKGITANGEYMTLISDSDYSFSVEYTADTKKYIDKKFAELQALYLGV